MLTFRYMIAGMLAMLLIVAVAIAYTMMFMEHPIPAGVIGIMAVGSAWGWVFSRE